jgi:hypothetical protein
MAYNGGAQDGCLCMYPIVQPDWVWVNEVLQTSLWFTFIHIPKKMVDIFRAVVNVGSY